MTVFGHPDFDQHESIHHFHDPASGLKAIIAIHSTRLGPAAGGCRRWRYVGNEDALTDALRLSRGMTYKNAIAGLPLGGGKAVILADGGGPKTLTQFAAFGRAVDALGGRYITAEDVGVNIDDMRIVRRHTRYVSGLPQSGRRAGGDPSPWTALGVFLGIRAAVCFQLGKQSLKGLRVAVQGVGHVGLQLCRLLHQAGAEILVADVNEENLKRVADEIPVSEVAPGDVLYSEVDVLAPCALGNVLNSDTIPRLNTPIVAGAANNQLGSPADGAALMGRGILYVPDYVINAGGIISVAREYFGKTSESEVRAEVGAIEGRLSHIFADAKTSGNPTNEVADQLARQILASPTRGSAGKAMAS